MKTTGLVLISLISLFGTAFAAEQPIQVQYDCDTVKKCACYESCNSVCRIVNGQQVCEDSCTTICDYANE